MTITDEDVREAENRMAELRKDGFAKAARYDAPRSHIVVEMSTGVEFSLPIELAQGLAGAEPGDLAEIEISAAGLGLHWPRLDADLYVPTLHHGSFGTAEWMAGIEGTRDDFAAKLLARSGTVDPSVDLEF